MKNMKNISIHNGMNEFLIYNHKCSGVHFIEIKKETMPVRIQFKGIGKPLFVTFHGAINQMKTDLPHFVGLSYANLLDVNVLSFADPALAINKEIGVGFYIGSPAIMLQYEIRKVIECIRQEFDAHTLILYGSSGGGLPVLTMSQIMDDGLYIVNSPSTSIVNHPNKNLVKKYFHHVWGCSPDEGFKKLELRGDIIDLHTKFNFNKNLIYFLINQGDKNSIINHFYPFFRLYPSDFNFICTREKITCISHFWGDGHLHPPARPFLNFVNELIKTGFVETKNAGILRNDQ